MPLIKRSVKIKTLQRKQFLYFCIVGFGLWNLKSWFYAINNWERPNNVHTYWVQLLAMHKLSQALFHFTFTGGKIYWVFSPKSYLPATSPAPLQFYNTVLSTITTMFYIISLELIHLIVKKIVLLPTSPYSPILKTTLPIIISKSLTVIVLNYTYKWYYAVFVFLSLVCFT